MLVQLLLQLYVNVRLLSHCTPQEESCKDEADGKDFPPGPLEITPHGAINVPDFVAGFAGGELDGLVVHLLFFT